MNGDAIRKLVLRARDVLLWSPHRAAAAAVVVAVVVVMAFVASVGYAGRRHATAAATTDASAACVRDADTWAGVFTDPRLDDVAWRDAVASRSTGKAAEWLPTLDRSSVPTGDHTVAPATVTPGACVVWVDFTDGHRWYLALVPGTDGTWRVDEWDDGA